MPNVNPASQPTLKPIEELLAPKPAAPAPPSAPPAPQPVQHQPAPTEYQPAPPAGSAQQSVSLVDDNTVSQEELEWAVALEQHAANGGQVSEAQLAKHTDIMQRLTAQREDLALKAGVSTEDFRWASELEQKSAQGYQAQPAEVQRYEAIAAKIQAYEAGASQAAPAPAPQPSEPAQPAPAPTTVDNLGNLDLVKEKPDMMPKLQQLSEIVEQNYAMKKLEQFTAPEAVEQRKTQARELGVGIWLEGDNADRVMLSQRLIDNGYSDVVGRIMTHQETTSADVINVMKNPGFPLENFMDDLKDNEAFLILNTLSNAAIEGSTDAANLMDKTVSEYDRVWDREGPFTQLRTQMQAAGTWSQLPPGLQQRINDLLN